MLKQIRDIYYSLKDTIQGNQYDEKAIALEIDLMAAAKKKNEIVT